MTGNHVVPPLPTRAHVEMPEIVREALASGKKWEHLTREQQEAGLKWMRNQRGANFWQAQADAARDA